MLAHLVLPLLLRHVEVGEADERAEREKRHRRKEPEPIAVHAPADGGGQHAEADKVVERVDLDTEALFLFGAVLFRAGDAPVEGIEQPREHQAQHGVERLVLRGGIEAAKPQQQREIGCDHGVVVNSDHKKPSDPFGLQHHYTRRRRGSIAKMLTRLLAVV